MLARNDLQAHTGSIPLKKKPKVPTQFMFIDSNNGGVNAKPDKIVRSFVMKSARNKKSWSTRPKSPKTKPATVIDSKRHVLSPKRISAGHHPVPSDLRGMDCFEPSTWGNTRCMTSPNSCRSDSISSCHSEEYACESYIPYYTSPSAETEEWGQDAIHYADLQRKRSQIRDSFDMKVLRSFNCLVVRLDANAESLLKQFIEAAAPRLIPIDPYSSSATAAMDWIKDCIQSPTGTPFIYAALSTSLRAAQLNPEVYKWRAMSELNIILSNPHTSINDTTIAAVLILLAIEEADLADPKRRGDERKCSMSVNEAHHNGLKTMIRQRGGLAALSGNRCLQVCLLMHSIAQAITTFRQPYAVLVDSSGQIEDYATVTSRSPCAFAPILRHFRELNLDRSLLKLVYAVAVFVADLKEWYDNGTCPTDSLDLQKHASLLMYRLFDWYQHSEYDNGREHTSLRFVDQSVCLALLIFMVNATEPNAASFGPRLSKTVARLRQTVDKAPLLPWSKSPDVFFWVLTMGALGAKGLSRVRKVPGTEPDASFFQAHIRLTLANRSHNHNHMVTADDLLGRMRTCLWIPSVFDERVKLLWTSMGLCGPDVVELEDTSSSEGEQAIEDDYALGRATTLRFFRP